MKLSTSHWLSGVCVAVSVTLSHFVAAAECDSDCQVRIEQGVQLYNQFEYDKAKAVFQAEADKGNAHARYWLGVAQYETGQYSLAGDSFLQAAEMGDPWAMDLMVPGGLRNPCDFRGWSCDESWKEKALKGWGELVELGDGKAKYAYYFNQDYWWEYIPFYRQKKRNEYYDDIIESGGYGLLMSDFIFDNEDKYLEYLIKAAENGYAPAMFKLFYADKYIGYEKAHYWIFEALNLGYHKAAKFLSYSFEKGTNGFEIDYFSAYYYHALAVNLGSDISGEPTTYKNVDDGFGGFLKDEHGNFVKEILVTTEQQAEIDKKVEAFLQRVKPNRFLDETTHKLFN